MFGIGIRGRGAGRKDNRLIRLVGDVKWETQPIDRRDKSAAALSAAVDRRSMIAAVSDSRTPSTVWWQP